MLSSGIIFSIVYVWHACMECVISVSFIVSVNQFGIMSKERLRKRITNTYSDCKKLADSSRLFQWGFKFVDLYDCSLTYQQSFNHAWEVSSDTVMSTVNIILLLHKIIGYTTWTFKEIEVLY